MRYEDYRANIIVDGQELDEYAVLIDQEEETATCYVPSQVGKNFSVKWTCVAEYRDQASKGTVTIDGIFCGASTIHTGERGLRDTAQRYHVAVDDRTVRQFEFAELATTDDDDHVESGNLEDVGEIKLEIRRGRLVPKTRRRSSQVAISAQRDRRRRESGQGPCDFERPRVVHERSKKALSHCVRFDSTPSRHGPPPSHRLGPDYALKESLPRISFVFRYRPLEVLQAQGFAPLPRKKVIPPPRPRIRPQIHTDTSNHASSPSCPPAPTLAPVPAPVLTPQPVLTPTEEDDSDIEFIEVRYPDPPAPELEDVQSRIQVLKNELAQLEARQAQTMVGIKQEDVGLGADIYANAGFGMDFADTEDDMRDAEQVEREICAIVEPDIIVIDD
ncbi:hypothetical protein CONPUDRAFT_142713 [Coniophora puteana RWD-64-598 SS2]|uniref:DUF7918 domain-containing protein n=1 Tax=Coniophora puteana (strain RWD-64-598) TaxID=741705 RepID=A0A5M3MZ34_CONPW|nr:uncharacterized protein CONPUDRAFT_142713 [Coniophora puteana RWD-64-598 SS2]EIW84408.1 hypothetical protein CONPUDRAFT_142713 [Coniophora puteana RWD-64-598 SS2]